MTDVALKLINQYIQIYIFMYKKANLTRIHTKKQHTIMETYTGFQFIFTTISVDQPNTVVPVTT